ncbi:tetratricopeptide repeat protein [Candidatus Peregrinibacteria bacterium]|nr:tetratricopeptide repeat protein [Candidatus Peregrinibacteria bacterium]
MEIILILIAAAVIGIFIRRLYLVEEHTKSLRIKPITEKESRLSKVSRMIYKGAGKLAPRTLEAKIIYSRAVKHYEKGDMEEAEKKLIQVTALDENFTDALHKLGMIYLKQDQFGKAEAIFKQLIYGGENDAVFFSNLGRALYEQKKYEEALEAYLKAIDLDATRPGRFVSAAEVYRRLDNKEKAAEMYKKAIELDERNIDYLLVFAQFLIDDGKIEQAKENIAKVTEFDPENETANEMMKEIEKG